MLFVDKKEINLQSRNHSYLNVLEQTMKKTLSKEGKEILSNNSYMKLELLKKKNVIDSKNYGEIYNRNSDSYRHFANSAGKTNNKENKFFKDREVDFSKFKVRQQKYTDIYTNNGAYSEIVDKTLNHTHNKSRNAPINKLNNEKIPSSLSMNLPNYNKILKENLLTKSIQQKPYNIDKKSDLVSNFTKTNVILNKKLNVKNNFLVNNYLNSKSSVNKAISLKKPPTNTRIMSKNY